jgi:hypothetical protein
MRANDDRRFMSNCAYCVNVAGKYPQAEELSMKAVDCLGLNTEAVSLLFKD